MKRYPFLMLVLVLSGCIGATGPEDADAPKARSAAGAPTSSTCLAPSTQLSSALDAPGGEVDEAALVGALMAAETSCDSPEARAGGENLMAGTSIVRRIIRWFAVRWIRFQSWRTAVFVSDDYLRAVRMTENLPPSVGTRTLDFLQGTATRIDDLADHDLATMIVAAGSHRSNYTGNVPRTLVDDFVRHLRWADDTQLPTDKLDEFFRVLRRYSSDPGALDDLAALNLGRPEHFQRTMRVLGRADYLARPADAPFPVSSWYADHIVDFRRSVSSDVFEHLYLDLPRAARTQTTVGLGYKPARAGAVKDAIDRLEFVPDDPDVAKVLDAIRRYEPGTPVPNGRGGMTIDFNHLQVPPSKIGLIMEVLLGAGA